MQEQGEDLENKRSDKEDDRQEEKQVSNSEAAECFKMIVLMETHNNVDPVQVMQLHHMTNFAM